MALPSLLLLACGTGSATGVRRDSGSALSLQGYHDASVWADAIALATRQGRMPPWPVSCLVYAMASL